MLTLEQIEEKRKQLETEHGRKVYAHSFLTETGEQVVGYLKDPDRLTKMRALDISLQSLSNAAKTLLEVSLIKEESSPLILDENSDDRIYFSFIMKANELLQFYSEQKKS